MKESKAVHVTKRKLIEKNFEIHEIHLNKAIRDRHILKRTENSRDIGCQFDSNLICTCRNVSTYRRRDMTYFSGLPTQICTYHGVRSFTDVGVGNVKVLQKKKVKRVYLPETEDRGVGSKDWSAHFSRRQRQRNDGTYYKNKRTSSKCIGGVVNYKPGSVMSQKLSPIIRIRSGTTSPFTVTSLNRNVNIGRNAVEMTTTKVENDLLVPRLNKATKLDNYLPSIGEMEKSPKVSKDSDYIQGINYMEKNLNSKCRITSSDSLIQHVHNLENPSVDKNIVSSLDHMENKLMKEHRNPKSSTRKDKELIEEPPRQELKSASFLRRRFEALRKGFVKKEFTRKTDVVGDKISIDSTHSQRDVSIVSDPPSLEGRSYSNTKPYSPIYDNFVPENSNYNQNIVNDKSYPEKDRDSTQWSLFDQQDSDYQGVKGMFRLWGKKFNLEEDYYKKTPSPIPSCQIIKSTKTSEQVKDVTKMEPENKKENKKFFFFKRKTKEKSKGQVKPKKSVTAGRCELSQGLMIKIAGNSSPLVEKKNKSIPQGMLEKPWLLKYLSQNIESRNSVQIRWNNSTYNTSSSTVFELMDTIYKESGIVFRSSNDVTTGESSYFTSCTQRVNFGRREVEAWMIPKTHQVMRQKLPVTVKSETKDNIELRISNQKWYIDKSKAFSNKIEVVLHSDNLVKRSKDSNSSEYLRIDIPKGFFIASSSSEADTKNESTDSSSVYNIVEYETQFDSKKNKKNFETGDHKLNDIQVVVNVNDDINNESSIKETVIKGPPAHRDVVIQGSNVNVPKRCNVIEVGIITQSDLREAWKPVPKVPEFLSDEESDIEIRHTPKKCEFAESFLQEYYRNWTPLGTDISSWCASDSNIKCWTENSESSFLNQGNGPKSCPNIYDDFQASAIVSSNDPCGACMPCPFIIAADDEKPDSIFTRKLFKKFKNKTKSGPHDCCKRVLPKDSLEVFKRRKIYATSNKAKWASPSFGDVKPFSIPSNEDKAAQDTMKDCSKSRNPNYGPFVVTPKKRKCKKHVSMPDYETMNKTLSHQLTNDTPEGILTFKGVGGCEKCKKLEQKCPKHAVLDRDSACKIPDPLCKEMCLKDKKAPCSTTSSKSDGSPICINGPKSLMSCGPPSLCKPPPACKPLPALNPPLSCSPPSPSMPKQSLCSSKLPSVTKKCSPIPPPSKKSSSLCKKCHSKTTSDKQTVLSPKNSRSTTPPCCKKISITHNSVPTCPNFFPPCKRTQSTQTSPKHSVDNSYSKVSRNKDSPQGTRHKKARPFCCRHGNDSGKKEKESSSHSSICNTTPCRKVSPQMNKEEDRCPHSLKDQKSNQSSLESVVCRPKQQPPRKKNINQCKKEYPLSPNVSNQSLLPKKRKNREKECKPNCVNMPKMQELAQCPPPSTCPSVLSCPSLPRKPESSKPIISGIFLKMKPSMKKSCSKDCLGWQDKKNDSTIKLRSNEKITIIVKKQTPSTEEIREGMNIKVKDIDGQTLYERRDYVQDHRNQADSILGDMYKSSDIYTASTPTIMKNVQTSNSKNEMTSTNSRSDTSITNFIEIQFKLKVAQGDKNTKINIANADDNETKTYVNESNQKQSHEVFMARNNDVNFNQVVPSENDVNIRIVIKNYKPNVKMKKKECTDDFTKKISEKFHTVSIGYSDLFPVQNADNVYAAQKTTVDLTSSIEKNKEKSCPSIECNSSELVEQEHNNFTDVSNSSKLSKSGNKNETENYNKINISSDRNLRINSQNFETNAQNEHYKPISDTENRISDLNTSAVTSTEIIEKPVSRKDKKELLRKIFEKANHTKPKNKSKMKKLRDMLKMILTSDSSGPEDLAVTSNELAKDVTYASLKPNYFRDTDSMNNYYKTDSTKSLQKQSVQKYHPTDEENSECSVNSEDTTGMEAQGCMCSTLAEKLNICKTGENSCCCRRTTTRNEEVCCDFGDHISGTNLNKYELVEEKSQNFICVSTDNNSNLNLKRKESNVIKNYPAVLTQHEVITTSDKVVNVGKGINSFRNKHRKVECNVKVNKTATLHISSRDETIIVKTKPTRSADVKETEKKNHCKIKRNETVMSNLIPQADILQSYETKRAVLQIYKQNTMSDNREHFVARLPKFAQFTENKIKNYEPIVTNYRNVSKKNIVMSVQK